MLFHKRFVCASAVVVLSGANLPAVAQPQAPAPPAHTRTVAIDGHDVRVQVIGLQERQPGAPAIVFEAGAGTPLDVWQWTLPLLEGAGPIVTYDRAGLGESEWDGEEPTPEHVARRLRALLTEVGVEPPFVLVGYSWGGPLVRYFAGRFPDEVAGVVYVDPGPIVTDTFEEELEPFVAAGSGEAGRAAFWDIPAEMFDGAPPAVRAEFDVFRGVMRTDPDARGFPPVPDVPVVVIVAAGFTPLPPFLDLPFDEHVFHEANTRHKVSALTEWALESSHGSLIVTNQTTHGVPMEDPGVIAWAVRRVLAAIGQDQRP